MKAKCLIRNLIYKIYDHITQKWTTSDPIKIGTKNLSKEETDVNRC